MKLFSSESRLPGIRWRGLRLALAIGVAVPALAQFAGCAAPRPAPVENRSTVTPGTVGSSGSPGSTASRPASTSTTRVTPSTPVTSAGSTQPRQPAPARPAPAQASPVRVGSGEAKPIDAGRPSPDQPADAPPSLVRSDASGARAGGDASGSRPSGSGPATGGAVSAPASAQPASPPPAASETTGAGPVASVSPSAGGTSDPARFSWPAPGRVLEGFSEPRNMGISIEGQPGDPVLAAGDGRVIFSGVGPRGYGNLIIVKHDNDLLSVYAHNRSLAVREGDQVTRGQKIAEIGDSDADRPKLRFEIRREGRPVDPSRYLPPRPAQ